jgi:hypothetical protein
MSIAGAALFVERGVRIGHRPARYYVRPVPRMPIHRRDVGHRSEQINPRAKEC